MTISLSTLKNMSGTKIKNFVAINAPFNVSLNRQPIFTITKLADVPSPAPTPPPTSPPSTDKPSSIVGRNWTVMAPFNKPGATNSPENLYIAKAELDSRYKPIFYVNSQGWVVFRCHAGGVHSPNSQYPRTELREMKDENWNEAEWSNTSGVHTMTLRESVRHNLVAKPEVVVAQIHGGDDDLVQIKLEGNVLKIVWNDGASKITIDSNYVHGTPFDLVLKAHSGKVDITYNGKPWSIVASGGQNYFKAGCYLQSNPDKGDKPDAWGEVVIHSLKITHQ